MKKYLILIALWGVVTLNSTSITFNFDNIQITGETEKILEFDIMAKAGEVGTRIGSNQIYLQYNTQAFGENIFLNNNVEITKGSLLIGELVAGVPLYNELNFADNAVNTIGIQAEYIFSTLPDLANELLTEYNDLFHIAITIQDTSYSSGILFDQSLMIGQQYESNNSTIYDPVQIDGDLNIYLRNPEQPTITSIESNEAFVTITWNPTAATTSYEIQNSDFPHGPFLQDTSGTFTNTSWFTTINPDDKKKFYRVVSHN